ncbi:RNA-directed DNA polymerase from mobile element jockey [Stylophora pistillata]|uniref:RNA-directed DNA polymerase from mobile element jockey n=1 Tax=Stylophora pistillata TaxID=50429 RepID=A0A2B4R915_STYPI|nr:RNA-directed DNA polymerase from mobile element jockey [Stylophora pistillata]
MVFLAAPEKFVVLDITVNMDVHPHPGPEEVDNDHGKRKQSSNSSDSACQPAIGQQRVIRNGFIGKWKSVNKGTTQGSVSGPHLFNVFLSDLEIHLDNKSVLVKYADDTTIISPVIGDNDNSIALINQFSQWSRSNGMCSNPSKCKEIIFRKKGCTIEFPMVSGIPQTKELTILGVTFQEDTYSKTALNDLATGELGFTQYT